MMKSAARSFTDWPGFMNSALPRIRQAVSSDARLSLISGVLPIASMIPLRVDTWKLDLVTIREGNLMSPGKGRKPRESPLLKSMRFYPDAGQHEALLPSFRANQR